MKKMGDLVAWSRIRPAEPTYKACSSEAQVPSQKAPTLEWRNVLMIPGSEIMPLGLAFKTKTAPNYSTAPPRNRRKNTRKIGPKFLN
jgi:hypothetical protein